MVKGQPAFKSFFFIFEMVAMHFGSGYNLSKSGRFLIENLLESLCRNLLILVYKLKQK